MKSRLEQFIAAENISQAQFADAVGVARASISHILSGRNKPGYDFICNAMEAYPALNIEWLLTGKGKMYKNAEARTAVQLPVVEENDLFSSTGPAPENKDHIAAGLQNPPSDGSLCANTRSPERKDNPVDEAQPIEKQRKIKRITVFFDDGTFQEIM